MQRFNTGHAKGVDLMSKSFLDTVNIAGAGRGHLGPG